MQGLQRQNSIQMMQENKGSSAGAGLCCGLPLAIAALVIASTYTRDGSDCDNDSFTIGLPTFLWVAGGVGLGGICFSFIIQVMLFMTDDMEKKAQLTQLMGGPACCAVIFNIVWASIGLNMYVNQLSDDCQQEPIGEMLFAWCLIQIICTGIALCCCCCLMFVIGGMAATNQQSF